MQVLTAPIALLIDALSYLVSALFLFRMKHTEPDASPTQHRRTLQEIAQGFGALWRDPILRPLLFARAIRTFFGGMIGPFYVLYVVRHLGVSPAMMGVLIACGGVAALTGAMLVSWLNARVPAGPGLIGAFAIKTVGIALLPLAGLFPALVIPLLVLQQILQDSVTSYFAVNERTLRQ